MRSAAVLVAAGGGERLGADRPKAFVVVGGRPMLEWSEIALRAAGFERTVVVVPEGYDHPAGVVGGETRSESVRAGLRAVGDVDRVVVHDAARPMVDPELFTRCLAELDHAEAGGAAARVTDTVKEAGPDRVVSATLDRSRLWAIQTPQAFRREALARALAQPDEVVRAATDDAMLVEALGGRVHVVESSPANFKVTTRHDLEVADLLLGRR
jgi:2-C-methyl-D-erythritol 4-phosphate cytidylyltransferase